MIAALSGVTTSACPPAYVRSLFELDRVDVDLHGLGRALDDDGKPVKVYILSGQSNMVGAGKVTGGNSRWGSEFIEPMVSVYEGAYDPKADYDALKPVKTLKLESFGGVHPTPYPGGGTHVTRGFIQVKATGTYEFRPGYQGSTIMRLWALPGGRAIRTATTPHTPAATSKTSST